MGTDCTGLRGSRLFPASSANQKTGGSSRHGKEHSMNIWIIALVATTGLCLLFAGVYVIARRMDNYGIVDIAWSYSFGGLALFLALVAEGWFLRRWVLAALVLVWSVRLGTHLYRRVIGHHPLEDRRYVEMRRLWSADFAARMFRFFQMQAVSIVLLGLPFFLAMSNRVVGFHPLEIIGISLWVVAVLGEAVADAQLAAFKKQTTRSESVCDVGLWRYSRHPNYFFEWLIWVSYFVFAVSSPWGWTSVIAPAGILYLLLRVTGIPMTEEQAVISKGDAYRRYQRTTSPFIPWFPKTALTPDAAESRPENC
jgi:steroid 5-alpha reductase family enzyme